MKKWITTGAAAYLAGAEILHGTVYYDDVALYAVEQPKLLHIHQNGSQPRPLHEVKIAVVSTLSYAAAVPYHWRQC